jgi:hypothetical protein
MISGCVLALLIGCSRTYLSLHWPSDVLGGWLLAAMMVSVTRDGDERLIGASPSGHVRRGWVCQWFGRLGCLVLAEVSKSMNMRQK